MRDMKSGGAVRFHLVVWVLAVALAVAVACSVHTTRQTKHVCLPQWGFFFRLFRDIMLVFYKAAIISHPLPAPPHFLPRLRVAVIPVNFHGTFECHFIFNYYLFFALESCAKTGQIN